jgi:predicted ester cyclase
MNDPGYSSSDALAVPLRRLAWTALALALALSAPAAQADHSAEEARNAAAFQRFAEAYNAQAERWFESFHNTDYVWEGYGIWAPDGNRLSYAEMLTMIDDEVRHFPDRRMKIHRLLADGSKLAVDYEWTGTAAEGVPGISPGTVMRWRNLLFLGFRDGKMSLATEYGVKMPEPAQAQPVAGGSPAP